jgi:hypothetical protein
LLGCFAITTLARTLLVAGSGALTAEVLLMAGTGMPVVLLGTWLGRRYPPAFGEVAMRRATFAALFAMGLWIGVSALSGLT